jgi:protein-S-isoprenylcysteine O-methyltransferase Ste14
VASLLLALILKTLAWLPIPIAYLPRQLISLLLFTAGLCLRFSAVAQLGRFFTTHVSIQHEHELITNGLYRFIQHPAYTGLLIALAAAGLAMGDAIALLLLTTLPLFAFIFRIQIEEQLLIKKFGAAYRDYSKSTRKLFPWLF